MTFAFNFPSREQGSLRICHACMEYTHMYVCVCLCVGRVGGWVGARKRSCACAWLYMCLWFSCGSRSECGRVCVGACVFSQQTAVSAILTSMPYLPLYHFLNFFLPHVICSCVGTWLGLNGLRDYCWITLLLGRSCTDICRLKRPFQSYNYAYWYANARHKALLQITHITPSP